jgi:hypothetical protein
MPIISLIKTPPLKGTRIDRDVQGKSSILNLDATLSESFSAPIELTQHPVERGVDISDHVILKPQVLKIEGVFSATKLRGEEGLQNQLAGAATSIAASVGQSLGGAVGAIGGGIAASFLSKTQAGTFNDSSFKQLESVIEEFLQMRKAKQTVTIITGLKRYSNFILTGFDVSRNQNSGLSFNVSLQFQELLTASLQTASVPVPAIVKALPKSDQGKKDPAPVTEAKAQSYSLLGDVFNFFRNIF